jgi:hypothetical protein
MTRSIDQMLWDFLFPVPLWRAGSVVRDFPPRICATVDKQDVLGGEVEAAVAIPCIYVG